MSNNIGFFSCIFLKTFQTFLKNSSSLTLSNRISEIIRKGLIGKSSLIPHTSQQTNHISKIFKIALNGRQKFSFSQVLNSCISTFKFIFCIRGLSDYIYFQSFRGCVLMFGVSSLRISFKLNQLSEAFSLQFFFTSHSENSSGFSHPSYPKSIFYILKNKSSSSLLL